MKNFNSFFNQLTAMPKRLAMVLTILFTLGVGSMWAADTWKLVTDANDLAAGDEVVIVASSAAQALSTTQNGNNRGQATVTKNSTNKTVSWTSSSVQILTLQAGKTIGTFAFQDKDGTDDGYLYAASSSKNYLRTESTLSANSSWNITITSAGVATIKATGTYTNNWLRYNSSSSIFSCYASGQGDVCIYKKEVAAPSHTITAKSNDETYGTVSLSGTTITATPKTGYRVNTTTPYTISPTNSATVTQNGNTFTVTPTANTTITINFEAIPTYTVNWYVNGTVKHTQTDVEGTSLTNIPTPTTADCDNSKVFVGWTTADYSHATTAPTGMITNTSGMTMPEGGEDYYAVFATETTTGGGTAFDGTSGGDFKIYALVEGEKKYLSGTGSKISPVDEAEATEYTFTKISDGVFSIKTGTTYLTYASSTNLGTSNSAYSWNISKGTKGSWRIASTNTTSRGIVYRAGTTNHFGGYATSNITANGTEYYDVEIGGGASVSYFGYITTCAVGDPCDALQAPNVTATATANSITLSWAAVDGATSYNIYNYTTEETDETTNLTYTFNGLDPNTEYEWEVEAVSATCNGKGKKGTTTTLNACEQLGVATDLTVETDYVHTDGKTYVKFSWTPADNTKNNAASQKLCFGKVGEAGKCVDEIEKNINWTGDEVSKLEPGTYWWSIQALGNGVNYCDGDVVNGTNFTIIAYNIIIDSNIQYGKVTTDLTQAVVDKTVTLTATPDKGYQFSSWIVTKDGGGTVEVTNNKFTMPASNVTVSATFEALPKLTTPTNLSVSKISCSNATLAWSDVAGASKYELRLTNTSTSNTTTSYPTTNSAYLTLASGTTYSWTVQAIGDGITYNNSDITEGEDFTSHYTITYNVDGGSTVEDGCGTTLPAELPTTTKSHYTFIGWYMDKELTTPATAGAKLTQNTTLYAKWEEIKFTITWSINGNTTNSQELQEGTTITPPADLDAATYACEDKVFVGWVDASIDGNTNEEPDFITDFGNVKEIKTYYAVFATPSGDGFTLGQSGDFTIYANVNGTNYYATGDIGDNSKNGKISSTTTESDANRYTFTAISASNEAFTYTIKKGTTYIAYSNNAQNNNTDFKNQDESYTWTISKGTKGSWRVASAIVGRAFVFRAGSGYNLFGGYATQNITDNQTVYYDIEIGGATTYTEYVTSCVTCENVLTISKGNEENGTFTLDKVGEQETCDGLSVLVTPTPAEHYHVASVTTSTGETAVNNGDGTYTITYAANSTGESTINVVFEEDTKYTITWMVNGLPYIIGAPSTTVYADERVATLPTPPEPNAYCGDVFVGWTTENPASGNFNEAPTVYNEQLAFPPATGNQTFYAVFADYDEQQ